MRAPFGVGCPYLAGTIVARFPGGMDEREAYEAAKLMLEEHGAASVPEAAKKMRAMLDAGDIKAAAVWAQIMKAIVRLAATAPDDGMVH